MTTGKKVKEALLGEFRPAKRRVTLTPGTALRIAREKNDMTQGELADVTGISQAAISSLENDAITLGADRARALAAALKIHPAVILFPDWDAEEEEALLKKRA